MIRGGGGSSRNRTCTSVLGGPRCIHSTMEPTHGILIEIKVLCFRKKQKPSGLLSFLLMEKHPKP